MKERFEGAVLPNLIAALKRQEFVSGDSEIADALSKVGKVVEFDRDQTLIVPSGADNEIYLLLAEAVLVVANGAEIGQRKAGRHIGEMSAIESSLPRSGSTRVTRTF